MWKETEVHSSYYTEDASVLQTEAPGEHGVYLTEEADGLPPALATALEDGTSPKVAGQRRGLRERLLDWAGSDEARELPGRDSAAGGP